MKPTPTRLLGVLERSRVRHQTRGRAFRIVFTAGGVFVASCGVFMLLLPGPGLAVLALGIGMLSLEFAWAETLLQKIACHQRFKVPLWALAAGGLALALVVGVAATL